MKVRFGTLFIVFLICNFSFASKIDKAFSCLNEMNYFEAKKLFYESFKKKPVPSSYGLATIFFKYSYATKISAIFTVESRLLL